MALRPGYRAARVDEFVEVGGRAACVGIYWLGEDGRRREPLVFQVVTLRDGQTEHIQDYGKRRRALKAAGANA